MSPFLVSLAHAGSVALLFNDPVGRTGPADQCIDEHCRALVSRIDASSHTIEFAVYGVREQTEVLDALVRALARGVRVRGVIDVDAQGVNYYSPAEALEAVVPGLGTDRDSELRMRDQRRVFEPPDRCRRPTGFLGPLQCLGYDLGDRCLLAEHASREPIDGGATIMHHKFFVFDGVAVWTGSSNVSDSGTGGYNANVVALVDSPVVASWYRAEFEELAAGRFHGEKRYRGPHRTSFPGQGVSVEAWFSPTDRPITRAVRPLIQQATSSIDLAVFFLTHKEIARDLIAAHQRGVRVRVLLDATAATNEYTKHELLRVAGIPVKIEDWGGKMHMKAAAIDGEHLIVGSMNWTSAGEGGNDENTLVLRGRGPAASFEAEFERLWASVPERWLAGRPVPESRDSGASCTDGVDNDFDGLVDAADPGCGSNPPALPDLPPHRIVRKVDGEGALLKGFTRAGERRWVWPSHPEYAGIVVGRDDAVWLCSSADARAAGYRAAPK